jgi:anti-sigma B factor antagonist
MQDMNEPPWNALAVLLLPDGTKYAVPEGGIAIGRRADSGLVLSDPQVSRRQANVYYRDGLLRVSDLGSMNGTWINGVRIAGEQTLASGDVLELGDTKLTVQTVELAISIAMPIPALGGESPAAPLTSVIPLRDPTAAETAEDVAQGTPPRLLIRPSEPEEGPAGMFVTIALSGVLDVETADEFIDITARMVAAGVVRFTLKLDGIDYLDSSGLGALVVLQRQVKSRSGSLELQGLQPAVRGVIELTRLDRVFAIRE